MAFLSYLGTNDVSVNLWPQCTAEYLRLFKNVTRDYYVRARACVHMYVCVYACRGVCVRLWA